MDPPFLLPPHYFLLFFFLLLFLSIFFFPTYFSIEDDQFSACNPFSCGNITHISYPFWTNSQPDYCGHPKFKLDCEGDNNLTTININSYNFRVIDLNLTTRILTIARMDLWGNKLCPRDYTNITLDYAFFNYTLNNVDTILLYDCDTEPYTNPTSLNVSNSVRFNCSINGVPRDSYFMLSTEWIDVSVLGCKIGIMVPILDEAFKSFIKEALDPSYVIEQGFEVTWDVNEGKCEDCRNSGGRCGYDKSMNEFRCLCSNQTYVDDDGSICGIKPLWGPTQAPVLQPSSYSEQNKLSVKNKVIVGVSVLAFTVIVMMIIGFALYKRRIKTKTSYAKSYITQSSSYTTSYDSSVVEIDGHGSKYLGAHVFTYSELEEATNHFDATKELGDGGFGTVYYGKLRDGRCVAVKRLYENNYKRVEQFQNEVAILTRLRHQNLVALYGCTSRHSRELLLVYEYISNGTVADHLHGPRATTTLPWNTRLNIAIETASALAYLHASDIIHRDVKTNNILLDDHFCVKVADFGLSRLFPNDVTHISTAPQGTPGYVDPEYHECYQLTDKSDVYSFGVVLVELISSLPAVDITRHRHEINLATMAVNKIHSRKLHEMVDPALGFERDGEVRKRISAVAELAFQCLQSVKDMRPYMREVVDVLRDIESDGKSKRKEEVMDICEDDVVLLKSDDFSPPSPEPHDSNVASMSTTPSNSTN